MTEQQKDFVQMYLKHNCKIIAHNLAYGNNTNIASVESSANRLLRIPEIADTIRSIQDNIRHEVEEEFKAKYREELLTIYDKRMLLKRIATGELYVEQKYKGKNCTQCSQYISPTINQMLAAIREDSRLAGHYPYKQNGKWLIPAQQTEQEQETELSPAAPVPQNCGRGVSLPADGGGTLAKDENPQQKTTETSPLQRDLGVDSQSSNPLENDNKRQQLSEVNSMRQLKKDINYELTEEENIMDNTSPSGVGGEQLPHDEDPENDNKRQQTCLSPAGGGVSQAADGGGTLAQENPPEKDNNGQHPEEITIDNQPLINNTHTSVNSSGQMISKEKLDELLYPNRQKRELNNNHRQKTTIMETETGE